MTDFYKNNDDLLRDKLKQHEFAPVPGTWENMSALLDQHQVATSKHVAGYWWSIPFVAAAALAGVIGLGVYLHPANSIAKTTPLPLAVQDANGKLRQAEVKPALSLSPAAKADLTPKTSSNVLSKTKKLKEENKKAIKANVKSVTKSFSSNKTKTTVTTTVANNSQEKETAILTETTVNNNETNIAIENAVQQLSANNNKSNKKPRVKTTRTEVIYQYSITPLRALQNKRKAMEQQNKIGTFGIGDELDTKKSPLKVSVFGGASAKMYGATKELSIMPYGGISASYRVAKRHSLQTGLQYKSMGHLPDTKQGGENDATVYVHGNKTTQANSITRIDLLEMPLVYQFHLHPACNIQAGIKGAWLFNTETNPELNGLTNKEIGLADFDMSILLGMEYCFNKHWSVGIQYSLGLINLTQQAKLKHDEGIQMDIDAGIDPQQKIETLCNSGELLVPVAASTNKEQMIKLPNQLRNNDLQVLLKYTF